LRLEITHGSVRRQKDPGIVTIMWQCTKFVRPTPEKGAREPSGKPVQRLKFGNADKSLWSVSRVEISAMPSTWD
jgi:hypothetical protein